MEVNTTLEKNLLKSLWDFLILASIIFIIFALIIEFFFHPKKETLELIHKIDIIALAILFIDLAYLFYKAKDKKNFIKEEWLLIISFLPFGAIFRFFRFLRATRIFQGAASISSRVLRLLRIEGIALKISQTLIHALKGIRFIRPIAQIFSRKKKK